MRCYYDDSFEDAPRGVYANSELDYNRGVAWLRTQSKQDKSSQAETQAPNLITNLHKEAGKVEEIISKLQKRAATPEDITILQGFIQSVRALEIKD